MRENKVEEELLRQVAELNGITIKLVRLRGLPDRLVVLPGGRVGFFELKRPKGGVIAPHQRWWISKLQSLGVVAGFLKTYTEVREALTKLAN